MQTRTAEEQLLLDLCSREFSELKRDELIEKLTSPLDWNQIFVSAMWHKVLFLVYENLRDAKLLDITLTKGTLPLLLLNHWKQLYKVNHERNRLYQQHVGELLNHLQEQGIEVALSKGGLALFGRSYTESNRKMYDVDLIGRRDQFREIEEAFAKHGFFHGEYSYDTESFGPLPEGELRKWLLFTRGLPNFIKPVDSLAIDHLIVQVQFKIGSTVEGEPLDADVLLNRRSSYRGLPTVCDEDLLIQLVLHLYRETIEETFTEWNMSWNLVKFTDLDRFLHHLGQTQDLQSFVDRVRELDLQRPCLYSFHYVHQIFPSELYPRLIAELADSEELLAYAEQLRQSADVTENVFVVGNHFEKASSGWSEIMGPKTT